MPKKQTGGKRRVKQKGKKRPLNDFFKIMLKAKADSAPSFKYKGNTYKAKKHKHLTVYKKV